MRKIVQIILSVIFMFYMGIYRGNIAVFDEERVIATLPYRVETLPEEAQKALTDKIPIGTTEEISKVILEYLS